MRYIIKLIPVFFSLFLAVSCGSKIKFPEGGYTYPVSLYNNIKDSFHAAYYGHLWCVAYDEPDLQTKPPGQNTIRLIYETAFGKAAVFILTENEIVVKQPIQGDPYAEHDPDKLNQLEKIHFRILQGGFPIQEMDTASKTKTMTDSLVGIYPKLLDPAYYRYLLDKSSKADSIPFKYSVKKAKLSDSAYKDIVNQINASNYWKLPLHIKCDGEYLDGYGFMLEVATPQKYNLVSLANCPEKSLKFSWACQAIINAAHLDDAITIVSEK